jgi:glucan 1,3-beta-glucosidase
MALYQRISGCRDLSLYGSGFWTFFNADELCDGNCQAEAVQIDATKGLYYFGLNTRFVDNLVVDKGDVVATSKENIGGWGAAVGGFLKDRPWEIGITGARGAIASPSIT